MKVQFILVCLLLVGCVAQVTPAATPKVIETAQPTPTVDPTVALQATLRAGILKVTPPTPKPTKTPTSVGKVGDRIDGGGIAVTLASAEYNSGKRRLLVDVIIENTGWSNRLPYSSGNFKVQDTQEYELTPMYNAPEPSLKSGGLDRGDKVRGKIMFDIPATMQGLRLVYHYSTVVDSVTIKFDIGQ